MKKIFAFFFVFLIIFTLALPAFAASGTALTISIGSWSTGKLSSGSYAAPAAWPSDLGAVSFSFTSAGSSFSKMWVGARLGYVAKYLFYDNTPVYCYGSAIEDAGWVSDSYAFLTLSSSVIVSETFYDWFTDSFSVVDSSAAPTVKTTVNIYDQTGTFVLKSFSFSGTSSPEVKVTVTDSGATFTSGSTSYTYNAGSSFYGFGLNSVILSDLFTPGSTYTFSGGSSSDVSINLWALTGFTFSVNVYDDEGSLLGVFTETSYPMKKITMQLLSGGVVFNRWVGDSYIGTEIECPGYYPAVVKLSLDGEELDMTNWSGTSVELTSYYYQNYSYDLYLYPDPDGDYLPGILGGVQKLWDAITDLPSAFFNLLKKLFIPSTSTLNSKFQSAVSEISSIFGLSQFDLDSFSTYAGPGGSGSSSGSGSNFDYDFSSIIDSSSAPEDIEAYYEIYGLGSMKLKFFDTQYLIQGVDYFRPFIRGFIALLLIFFNWRQFLSFIGHDAGSLANGVLASSRGGKEK